MIITRICIGNKQDMEKLICDHCGKYLKARKTEFNYLGFRFNETVPCCPECGQVYISEELVLGKMHPLEADLEEK